MKELHCDLETFSSADLSKTGVYRYAESPDFEILLFGYCIDDSPVQVIDLARGEKIPAEVLRALTDATVIKTAHNSAFERVCLSRHLGLPSGEYLDPKQWRCSMVWSAYLGLPLSLAGVGAVLKLEKQKLETGKDLIRYFCQPCAPTKMNGGRTRNRATDAPDKWALFKSYNLRDVETEMAIQEALSRFPVPDFIWDEYHLDQEINDRGIRLDMTLVENAIRMDELSREELTTKMQALTALDNPNSVAQMKAWLADNGLELESLGKKKLAAAFRNAPDGLADVLLLRQQLAKASVKKYQAMKNCVCADGRAHGMFMFYGANRTGRFCLTGDHEVLTPDGWKRLDEWPGGSIACWNADSEAVSFQKAEQVSFDYSGLMYTYQDARIDQCSTPDHKMWAQRRFGSPWSAMTVKQMSLCRPCVPLTGYRYFRGRANQSWLRVLIMTQADGYYCEDGSIRFRFKKQRKVERCKMLLRRAEIAFSEHFFKDSVFDITIPVRSVPLWLRQFRTKTFGYWLFEENPDIFFDELPYWDGYRAAPNSIQYSTVNRKNADIVQALAHMSGRTAIMRRKKRTESNPKWSDSYIVDIWLTPRNCHEIRSKPTVSEYAGKVFCAVTSTGYFLTRRNGKVWVTGNSGRLIQLQNLPQNHMVDLEQARALVRGGDYETLHMLYDSIPDVLSELIRTAFVPYEGGKFIVSDFSAIEARVIAWLAGEQWRLEVFKNGGDIYCASASQMLKVPVEKHGVNGHLRQKGKIAELACISEGQLVLTNHGEKPIETVTTDDLLWDGEGWVLHEGLISKGERVIIAYEGLSATRDHLVWVEGKPEPVQFGIAASCGAHLVQTGDGGKPIRLGKDYFSGKTVEQDVESLLCADSVCRLHVDAMAEPQQLAAWHLERLPTLFSSQTNPPMVGEKVDCSEATMREPKRRWVSQLWGTRHSVRLCERQRSRALPDSDIRPSEAGDGIRSHRYKWGLCTWESSVRNTCCQLLQSAKMCAFAIRTTLLALCTKRGHQEVVQRNEPRRNNQGCGDRGVRETKELAVDQRKARVYDIRNAGAHHRFTVSGRLVHNCGYGGSIGAMKAMGGMELGLTEAELKKIVADWRAANPNIVKLWWDVDAAVKETVSERVSTETHGIRFVYESGFLFICLPSGRRLAYVKPRIGENRFGGESVTYEGIGGTKKWERLESFGGKFVENIVQGLSRDILCYAMKTLQCCKIVAHVHDEIIIEADPQMSLQAVCEQMGRTPPWAKGLILRADGFETLFYKKD